MALPNLTPTEIQPSKPTKSELYDKLRLINDDIEARVAALEGTSGALPFFSEEWTISSALSTGPDIELNIQSVKNAVTVGFFRVTLLETSGGYFEDATVNGLEFDLQKSTTGYLDADFIDSLFFTKPFINFQTGSGVAAGDTATGTFDLTKVALGADDRLRVILTTAPAFGQTLRFKFEVFE